MNDCTKGLKSVGLSIPTILLPNKQIDLHKWAVVACDQFTSEPEYWEDVEKIVANSPSTYRIILPEVYLEAPDKMDRINFINQEMQFYLDEQILMPTVNGFILIRRKLKHGVIRTGLLVALDLDDYNYTPNSKTLIRATEKTVLERIPPRILIRENAPIEVPHIMVLIDDPLKKVIEPIADFVLKSNRMPIYDTELMLTGGHVTGYEITDMVLIEQIAQSLESIKKSDGFLMAVGDGNHSLATAKQCWEKIKPTLNACEIQNHPARFTMVEINNIFDEGLCFEPIHRIVVSIDRDDLLSFISGNGPEITITFGDETRTIRLKEKPSHLVVGVLQLLLDEYLSIHPNGKIDYIHGEQAIRKLSVSNDSIGFLLQPMNKQELFTTVQMDGALPRKTFSMGEAEEKRYYLECRRIK